MRKNIFALAALTVLMAASAASCGKDTEPDGEVSLALPVQTTESAAAETTTAAAESTATKADKTTAAKETSTEAVTTKAEEVTEAPTEEVTEAPTEEEKPDDSTPSQPAGGVSFDYGALNANAASYTSMLGTPADVQSATGCLSNGADQKIYTYSGLKLSCYVIDGVEYIYDVTITGSGYSTSAGIAVGSSRSDVEAAYGAGEESGGYMIYYSGSNELDIQFSGDTVSSITFYTEV